MPAATKLVLPKAGASGSSKGKGGGRGPSSQNHPPYGDMIMYAVQVITEEGKKAASLQAIKKCLDTTYHVDVEKQGQFIRNGLRRAVEEGQLVQVSGHGVSGSFRLPRGGAAGPAKGRKPRAKKSAAEKKTAPAPRKPKVKRAKKALATPVEPTEKKAFKAARMAAPAGYRPVKQEMRATPQGATYRNVKPFALVKRERRSGN